MNPNLSPAEIERLAVLVEELGEALQAAGKVLRHGYSNYSPFDPEKVRNRASLTRELGHVLNSIDMLCESKDIDRYDLEHSQLAKQESIKKWLWHQKPTEDA